ncbi:MAG: isochorismate synthase [Acidimicrobiales bacterium]|nr:isochorismate synthase [Acidimicrobiales bacterium]
MTGQLATRRLPVGLVAVTRRLDRDVDLLAVAGEHGPLLEQEGMGLAGQGEVARLSLAGVTEALAALPTDDEVRVPGTGPVAFAAIPFDPRSPAEAVVPRVVVGRSPEGTRWVTTIGPAGGEPPTLGAVDDVAPPEPSAFRVAAGRPPAEWCRAVATARDRIRAGSLDKVVLAREVLVDADRPFARAAVLGRLRRTFPSCLTYAVGGFVGASPELLVARAGDVVRSHPLAGTAPRSGDPTTDARLAAGLLASVKDGLEHRITIDAVLDALLPFCSFVDAEAEPSVVAVANVQHLGTLVEGRLSHPLSSALELVAALHPTPAVGGHPRPEALALIAELEGVDRGRFAGAVGWVDGAGNGRFAVAIRCAELEGTRARLFAGVGVVADSDPDAELAETRAKLQAMLPALVRP